MIKTVVAIAGSATLACAPVAWADTLYLGGTGQDGAPTQQQMAWLIDDKYVGPDTMKGIDYPADLWPLVGPLSLDRSVGQGLDTLDEAIANADGPVTVVGVSQGALVINYEKRRLMAESAPRQDISFVTIGDPTNSDGGVMTKLPALHIPFIDFTIAPAPVDTPYPTTEIVREYDGVGDWPDRSLNVLADVNALMGGFSIHPYYNDVDLADPDNVTTHNGNVTHIVVKTDQLPLTQPLRAMGVDNMVVDAIDKPLRRIIDRAYDGPRPGKPSDPQSLNNVRVAAHERPVLKRIRDVVNGLGEKRAERRHERLTQRESVQSPSTSEPSGSPEPSESSP